MNLKNQKRLSSRILKTGLSRVRFDPARLDDIKEALTKADIRSLVKDSAIYSSSQSSPSRYRIRKALAQKRKGRRMFSK